MVSELMPSVARLCTVDTLWRETESMGEKKKREREREREREIEGGERERERERGGGGGGQRREGAEEFAYLSFTLHK